MDTSDPKKIIEAMVQFMTTTNEQLKLLKIKIDNQQVDIDNLKKQINRRNNRLISICDDKQIG